MSTIFTKIINKEIPAEIVLETENILAFKDINPQAPVHVLVIPKKEIPRVENAENSDQELMGELLLAAREVAELTGIKETGFRLVINNGSDGGQEVEHLHIHVLGGRKLDWPPG